MICSVVMANHEAKKLSRQERRNLDIEIDFLSKLVRRAPDYIEALEVLGHDYTRRGRFDDGLKVDEQLAILRPEDPTVLYNLGCSYALTGQPERAAEVLNRAIDRGYADFAWMTRDPDLADFRKHPLYRKLRARIRALVADVTRPTSPGS